MTSPLDRAMTWKPVASPVHALVDQVEGGTPVASDTSPTTLMPAPRLLTPGAPGDVKRWKAVGCDFETIFKMCKYVQIKINLKYIYIYNSK